MVIGATRSGFREDGPVSVEATLLFVLAAVAVVVVVRWIADKTGLPSAALLTIAGILYAVLPGPNVQLDPQLILTFVIPPLLYNAALDSSLIDIRRNLRTVISLSVALVLATALLIGVGFDLFVAGATFAAGRWVPPSRRPIRSPRSPSAARSDCRASSSRSSRARACSTTRRR